jgi:hydrogenase/urease accessory protein HupE
VIKGGAGTVDLNPTWLSAATGFIGLGVAHIVGGLDHLLFLMCLIIPLRGLRQLLTVVTGFTLAHSFTLIGSAFGLTPQGAWFPPFVEMVIALSLSTWQSRTSLASTSVDGCC